MGAAVCRTQRISGPRAVCDAQPQQHPWGRCARRVGARLRPIQTDVNQAHAEMANALKEITRPDATIAVVMAGVIPYFLDRPVIDVLGKTDAHVGRLPMHRFHGLRSLIWFTPGHLKWDFAWSIGTLRPDIVVGVGANEEARRHLEGSHVEASVHGGSLFVLRDSDGVVWSRLEGFALGAGRTYPHRTDDVGRSDRGMPRLPAIGERLEK